MLQSFCISLWPLVLSINDVCLNRSPSSQTLLAILHECTLPPFGESVAPQLMPSAAHYFSFSLCHVHKRDSPLRDLNVLGPVHVCFCNNDLQFSSNFITFIKKLSTLCLPDARAFKMQISLTAAFHTNLQQFHYSALLCINITKLKLSTMHFWFSGSLKLRMLWFCRP